MYSVSWCVSIFRRFKENPRAHGDVWDPPAGGRRIRTTLITLSFGTRLQVQHLTSFMTMELTGPPSRAVSKSPTAHGTLRPPSPCSPKHQNTRPRAKPCSGPTKQIQVSGGGGHGTGLDLGSNMEQMDLRKIRGVGRQVLPLS